VPCPCCIAAIIGTIIITAPMMSISTLLLGNISAFLLILVIILFYFLSEKIVEKINKPYPVVLGNFMIFVGLYFLIAMSILPNLSRVLLDNYDSFTFSIPYDLLGIFGVLALVVMIVYFIESKTNYLN
jgi:predicted transporter